RDRAVDIARAARVEARELAERLEGEGGRGGEVRQRRRTQHVVLRDRDGAQRDLVNRVLVDDTVEPGARGTPRGVSADAPVAGVVLCSGLRVGTHERAVEVELHAVCALTSHAVVPQTVVAW